MCVGVEDEGADSARAWSVGIGAREEEERSGVLGRGDEQLRARDAPAVAVRLGGCAKRACVRARLGLGEREGADQLAAGKRRNETRALLVGAEHEERKRHGARVHADRDAHSGITARKLLEDEDVGQEICTGAAVLVGHADAHQPELGELAEDLLRETVLAVPLGSVRLDLGRRKLSRQRLDLPLLGAELEVHHE